MMPCAPARLTAVGSPCDSALITAAMSSGETACARAAEPTSVDNVPASIGRPTPGTNESELQPKSVLVTRQTMNRADGMLARRTTRRFT
jgi:hypothetical protein